MSKSEQRECRVSTYGMPPVSSGPWWLGFNDAKRGLPCEYDYILLMDAKDYEDGYKAGKEK